MIETSGSTAAAVAAAPLAAGVAPVPATAHRTRLELGGDRRAAGPITSQGTTAPVAGSMHEVGGGADVRFAAPSGLPARSLLV